MVLMKCGIKTLELSSSKLNVSHFYSPKVKTRYGLLKTNSNLESIVKSCAHWSSSFQLGLQTDLLCGDFKPFFDRF